jgi:peptide deformylase
MSVRPVLKIGAPLLRKVAVRVENFSNEKFSVLIDDMVDTMRANHGVGLAAPQIGVSRCIIVLEVANNPRYPGKTPIPLKVLVNPEIISHSDEISTGWEGCLSLPRLRGEVVRYERVVYVACDQNGQQVTEEVHGFMARIIQHELDHLNGILYLDRVKDITKFGFEDSLERF